jgi:hypothetical protein
VQYDAFEEQYHYSCEHKVRDVHMVMPRDHEGDVFTQLSWEAYAGVSITYAARLNRAIAGLPPGCRCWYEDILFKL